MSQLNWALLITLIWLVCSLFLITPGFAQCDGIVEFSNRKTLDAGIEYTLDYKVDESASKLIIRLRAKNTGFLGFGLSESGHMVGSDILTVAVVNGEPVVDDRFAHWDAFPFAGPTPQVDKCNQWETLCAGEQDGFTDVVLARPLDTKDTEDRVVRRGEMPVIFSWGASDVVVYHGPNRGSTIVAFYNDIPTEFTPPNGTDQTFELVLNDYQLTSAATQYVLQKFDVGESTQHIIAIEPLVRDEDLAFVHHMVVHDCGAQDGIGPLAFLRLNTPLNAGGLSILGLGPCTGMVAAWGKGADGFEFPSNLGYRIGNTSARYIVLEVHLDNPQEVVNRTVQSGVKLYTTSSLREHDIGVIVLGDATVRFDPIPAGESRVHYESTCPSQCTSTFDGPIHIFQAFPHMHSYGREIWTTKYGATNNDSETISYKQFWNFNFQDQLQSVNITIQPGDHLSTHCVYDTSKTGTEVDFGTSSTEEMCMDFVMYYPKQNAGLNCGFKSPTQTICRNGIELAIPNPQPDGRTQLPEDLALGDPPQSCDLGEVEGETAAPSPRQSIATVVPTSIVAGDSSSKASPPPSEAGWGARIAFVFACIAILFGDGGGGGNRT